MARGDGSREEPRRDPAPFSCHADVERLLLEAQLEPDGAHEALPAPSRDEEGAAEVSERLRTPRRPPGREEAPRPRPQVPVPQDPARSSRSCAPCPEQRCAKDRLPYARPPPPVRWALRDGAALRRKRLLSPELLLLAVPALLLSHALTLGLGIYIGKRLAAASATAL